MVVQVFIWFQRGSFKLNHDIWNIQPAKDDSDNSLHNLKKRSTEEMEKVLNAAKGIAIENDRRKFKKLVH